MAKSALFGHPPNIEHDYEVIKAIGRVGGIYPGKLDPSKGLPIYAAPAGSPDPWCGRPNLIANIFVLVFVVILTGARLMLRAFRRELKLGWDDWAIIPATAMFVGYISTQLIMYLKGRVGHHIGTNTYEDMYWYNKGDSLSTLFYFMTTALVKISIALFNRRLTGISSRKWTIAEGVFVLILTLYFFASIFTELFICWPLGLEFDIYKLGALDDSIPFRCGNLRQVFLGLSSVHIITDMALLSVPLIIVARLKSMSKSKKIRLMILFSIGFVSMVGGVTRMVHVVKIDKDLDRTWIYNKYNTWALVDLTFGITAASLPVFNSFIFPSKWPKANRLPHLSPFKAKHSNGVSRRLPSAEDMQWAPTHGRHMSQKYYTASFLPPDGEQYQGKGPDDMSLEFITRRF